MGILEKISAFFLEIIPDKNSLNIHTLEQNQKTLSFAVRILQGILPGHIPSQTLCRNSGVLDLVYKLSDPKIKIKEVGKYCEEIIEYFLSSESPYLDSETRAYVKSLKQAELLEKKKKAELAKAEALKKMGFAMKKPVTLPTEEESKNDIPQPAQLELKAEIKNKYTMEDFKEEKVLACISCHEGYLNKPDQIVGVYTYTKKLKVPEEVTWLANKPLQLDQNGFTTVTHFNCIHLHCHMAAAKADKGGKKPKGEWEGAIIRNSHTKCNGWFPIRGPQVKDPEYDNGLLKLYQTLEPFAKPVTDFTWVHICDLNNLLNRFAKHETFSKETKGGAAEHNLKLIPFHLQLISSLLKMKQEKLTSYMQRLDNFSKSNTKDTGINQTASYEDFMLTLTVGLLCIDPAAWNNEYKLAFLYNMMSVGANLIRGKTNVETAKHNIASKVYLSPEFEPKEGEEIPHLSLDEKPVLEKPEQEPALEDFKSDDEVPQEKPAEKSEKTEKLENKGGNSDKNANLEKFLNYIIPLMIITKLTDSFIAKIHGNVTISEGKDKKPFALALGEYITNNYEKVVELCEELTNVYKDEILKIKYFEAFLTQLQLKAKIEELHQSVDQFLAIYL